MVSTEQVLGYGTDQLEALGAIHTAREIAQQPAVWRDVTQMIAADRAQHETFLRPQLARPELRIILAGAGTSAYAGQLLAPVLRRRLGRRVDAVATTDIVADPHGCLAEDVPTLLISFSRSGDSPEAVAATDVAEALLSECHHLVVTCNRDGQLYRAHRGVPNSLTVCLPDAANDRGFAMTSSFTGMVLATLLLLDTDTNEDTAGRLADTMEELLPELAERGRCLAEKGYDRFTYLGSGALHGLARESALKLLELSAGQVFTHADSCLGFRHGPKAVLTDRTLAIVYLSSDPHTRCYDRDLVGELRQALGPASVLAVGAGKAVVSEDGTDGWSLPGLNGLHDGHAALCLVVLAQTLALNTSLQLGHRPDNPFPSREVNRVVQGVTIHPLV